VLVLKPLRPRLPPVTEPAFRDDHPDAGAERLNYRQQQVQPAPTMATSGCQSLFRYSQLRTQIAVRNRVAARDDIRQASLR
jgi:hypothetical protein